MKRWECTVCGYIHEGPEPPETCPVCGADRDKFVELPPETIAAPESVVKKVATPDPSNRWKALYSWTIQQMTKQHAHPISVHIPNGVLPVAVVFLLLSLVLESTALADASFYNMLFVALVMPFVLFSGYNDWKRLFEGNMSRLFLTKMICGAILAISAPLVVVWKIVNPDVLAPSAPSRPLYVIIHLVMFAAAVLAGFLGGKLVIFRGVDKE